MRHFQRLVRGVCRGVGAYVGAVQRNSGPNQSLCGKNYSCCRTFAYVAVEFEETTVLFHHHLDKRQTQACTLLAPAQRTVDLDEWFADALKIGLSDSNTAVADSY